ncbi:MAG: sialate O-acetylesterase [Verrucomicrobiota bacterium]
MKFIAHSSIISILGATYGALPVSAGDFDLKLATPFTDHMVLQQEKPVPIWGWADAGEQVRVEFAGQSVLASTDDNGRWQVNLEPLTASSESRTLSVSSDGNGKRIELTDVLVGEVWLGSGQSNMVMPVRNANNGGEEAAAARFPRVRLFKERSGFADEAQTTGAGEWLVCTPESVAAFSATLFFFGRELHKELDVPIGLIVSAVGSTGIESWISVEAQRANPDIAPYPKVVDALRAEGASEEMMKRYEKQLAQWEENAKKARAEESPLPSKPRNPAEVAQHKNNIGGLFNGKIAPLVPYALRGVVWYQGENNTLPRKALYYRHHLPTLVRDWRARWDDEFPFCWVQLPNYTGTSRDWPTVREAMLETTALPKTGLAVTIDIGDAKRIHPKNKQEVGRRLALWALGEVYGKQVPATCGPLPEKQEIRGKEIVVRFKHTNKGLIAKDGELTGFTIAGKDRQWKSATAKIEGTTVVVSSPDVRRPVAVRYAWENLPTFNLYNGAGLPASPFRTDRWPWPATGN